MKRLSQFLAIEKQIKTKCNDQGSALLKVLQKPELFTGHRRDFLPLSEESEQLESDNKMVTFEATKVLREILALQGDLLDVTLTKDEANTQARATLTLGDKALSLPVTYLLWLEKQLNDLKTVFEALPTLDPGKAWKREAASGLYCTDATKTARNKKKKVVLIKYEATDKHPAQTEVFEEEVLQGYWATSHMSSALPPDVKVIWLRKVEGLLKQVKEAREEANSLKVEDKTFSDALLEYLALTP